MWICSGYMAPEYAMHGQLSAKADVYSFGVLLMELITGRKNADYNSSPEMQILLRWVRHCFCCITFRAYMRLCYYFIYVRLTKYEIRDFTAMWVPRFHWDPRVQQFWLSVVNASASTSSASSYLAPAPPSNASVSGFELVMFIRQLSCYSCNVIMCLGLTVSVSSEVRIARGSVLRIARGSMLRSVEPVIYKISFLWC
jgi:hypothetical protein